MYKFLDLLVDGIMTYIICYLISHPSAPQRPTSPLSYPSLDGVASGKKCSTSISTQQGKYAIEVAKLNSSIRVPTANSF